MTICLKCKRTYVDQDFRVCPFDGSVLSQDETAFSDPLIGKVLGERYRIVERIGQGGMGCVYKAVHIEMDRLCAIKLLLPMAGDHESARARFRREAKLSSRIDSPNAVTIYDFGEAEGGQFYLAMEYIEGEPLAMELHRQKSLPIERVVNITNQIAAALAAAHTLGIVHRDLKPANIMLTRKNDSELVKVLDFGIAKTITDDDNDKLTQTGYMLGTPTFMSPEQVLGEKIDSRSDVYSLAIIVYQMLSGSLPFDGETVQTLIMKRVHGVPTPLRTAAPSLSAEIEQVVMSGLEREPGRRVTNVDNFAAALRSAVAAGNQTASSSATLVINPELRVLPDQFPPTQRDPVLPNSTAKNDWTTIAAVKEPAPPPVREVPKRSRLVRLLIPVFALALLVGVVAVAYLIYYVTRPTTQATTTTTPPVNQTTPGTVPRTLEEEAANTHFEAGKRYQQEAASLNSTAEAVSRNNSAVAEYRKALEKRSNFPEARENLGVALYELGRVSEAIVEYEIAINQYGKPRAQVLANYGMALIVAQRFVEAADAFASALVLNPSDSDLHYYSGFALYHAGDKAGSRKAFTQYLEQAPNGPHASDVKSILDARAVPTMKQTRRS